MEEFKKLMILKTGGLTDFILISGYLKYYREKFFDYEIVFCVDDSLKTIIEYSSYIDRVLSFDKKKLLEDSNQRDEFIKTIQNEKFDVVIYPSYSRELIGDLICLNSRASEIIAFEGDASCQDEKTWVQHNSEYTRTFQLMMDIKKEIHRNHLFSQDIVGRPMPEEYILPEIRAHQKDIDHVEELFRDQGLNERFMIVIPFSDESPDACWPIEKWCELLKMCLNYGKIVLIGDSKDQSQIDQIERNIDSSQVINLCGKLTLGEMCLLFAKSKYCIGIESGLLHLATSVGTSVLGLSLGINPGRFIPYHFSQRVVYSEIGNFNSESKDQFNDQYSVSDITLKQVADALMDMGVHIQTKNKKHNEVISKPKF